MLNENRIRWIAACLIAMAIGSPASSQEWTRFRGPNGTAISDAKGIPTTFSESDYNWKVELPGIGHSQPVLWGEKIFVTSAPRDGGARYVSCLSTKDGRELWKHSVKSGDYHNHRMSSFASSTPTVDADHVYVSFQHPQEAFLVAIDHAGNEKWTVNIGGYASQHGFGTSPILYKDTLIFACEQLRGDSPNSPSFVIALDRKTGNVKWKTPRKSRRSAYGTPCLYKSTEGRDVILFSSGACGIYSLDAETGKPLWDADVFDKRTVSSPVIAGGLIIGTCGSGGGGNYLVAIRPGGKGDVRDTHEMYRIRKQIPYVPTSVARDNKIFMVSDKGIATCIKASTGEELWVGRIDGSGGFSGSPVWIEGRLFCMSHRGDLVVLGTGDKFEILGRSKLGELTRSTPAVAGGRLYLRTEKHLISVGGKK